MFGQGDQIGIAAHKFLLGFVQFFAVQALIADGDDLRKLADSYRKVVRLLALIGLPLSVVLWFTAQELVLIIFGDQWQPSVPVFRILALSVGIQIVMSTSGSIFQAANATRMLFFCGLFSAALNTAAICTGIFAFGTTQAVAWCICISFAINFIQCYHALFCLTLRTGWGAFWRSFLSPLLLSALVCLPLAAADAYARVACGERRRGAGRVAALHPVQRRIRPERNRPPSPLPQKPITQ